MTEERIDGEETKEKKKPKKSLKRELMEDVIMIVFVLVTVWVMKNYVLINAVIPSASMEGYDHDRATGSLEAGCHMNSASRREGTLPSLSSRMMRASCISSE